jgi:hypothetical protein
MKKALNKMQRSNAVALNRGSTELTCVEFHERYDIYSIYPFNTGTVLYSTFSGIFTVYCLGGKKMPSRKTGSIS